MYEIIEEKVIGHMTGMYDKHYSVIKKFGCVEDAVDYIWRMNEPVLCRFMDHISYTFERYYDEYGIRMMQKEFCVNNRIDNTTRYYSYYINKR